jgi:uncharacterized protein YdaT
MLQEAIEKVEQMAQAELEPKAPVSSTVPGLRNKVYTTDRSGTTKEFTTDPLPRLHTLADLSDMVAAAKLMSDSAIIWIGDKQVVAILDDSEYRENRLIFPLAVSKPMEWVQTHCASRVVFFNQSQFIQALRTDLARALDGNPLLGHVRAMRFSSNSSAEATITQGRESMGRQIERTATGAGELPEKVIVAVPVYDQLPKPLYPIECALVVDTVNEKFGLQALPGEVLNAYQQAQAQLRTLIVQAQAEHQTDFPVYAGTP